MDDVNILTESYIESQQEEYQALFAIVDYYLLKSTQTEKESDRADNWKKADEIRAILTGTNKTEKKLLGGKSLNEEQLLEFMKQKKENGTTYAEFITQYL
jgi:flagellar biosynthesis/type III secretory pathway chaperone